MAPATPLDPSQLQQLRQDPLTQYQDVVWAVAFILHLIAMIGVIAVNWSSNDNNNNDDNNGGESSSSLSIGSTCFLVGVTGSVAVGLSIGALSLMVQQAERLVQMALLFSVATSLAVAVLGFMTGSLLMGGLGLLSFAIGVCYARAVWRRIPFAAVNLATALACVQRNLGLSAVSLIFTALALGWTVLWFMGVGKALESSNEAIVFLLVRSLTRSVGRSCKSIYWTTFVRSLVV